MQFHLLWRIWQATVTYGYGLLLETEAKLSTTVETFGLDDLPTEFAVSAGLLLVFIRISRDIYVLPVFAKILPKIHLESSKRHLESLIDRKQATFRRIQPCTDNTNTIKIIVD